MARVQLFLAAFVAVWLMAPVRAGEDYPYVENELNFVDGSMDISQGIPEDSLGRLGLIKQAGVLRVAVEPYYVPQEFIDPAKTGQEQYVGADMDLARRIAEHMEVELEIVPMPFSKVLTAVAEGDCDLAISALSFIPSRASMVEMSKGYHFVEEGSVRGTLLIRQEDAGRIRTMADMADKVLAVQSGSVQEALMAEHIRDYHMFVRLPAVSDVYDSLVSGKADVGCMDLEMANYYLETHPECGLMILEGVNLVLDERFEGDRVAGKKGDYELMYFINGVIDEVLESGEYEKWFEEYTQYAIDIGYE